MDLKNYDKNPGRVSFGWSSNNSIYADIGMDYSEASERIRINGEPGLAFLENMRKYSRLSDSPDWKDEKVLGANPCLEQSLHDKEVCCLTEVHLNNNPTKEEFLRTLKFSYLLGKTITLGMTHWPEINRVVARNRRIGNSLTGITQFLTKNGLDSLRYWCEEGYHTIQKWDTIYSDWLAIPKSIKTTSVKPSGTVSLLSGHTPGGHFPDFIYGIRRMRISDKSNLVQPIRDAGYHVEPDQYSPNTLVVEVPVCVGENLRTLDEISMWEQLSMAAFLQQYWADNQVSYTVTFDPETEGDQIEKALDFFQYRLKAVSFLPRPKGGVTAYAQAPYEPTTKEQYDEAVAKLKPIDFSQVTGEIAEVERFCTTDKCELTI